MFRVIRFGHEDVDVAPDQLRLGIAEEFADRGIDGVDDAVLGNGDNPFHGRVQNGAQPLLALERLRRLIAVRLQFPESLDQLGLGQAFKGLGHGGMV